MQKTDYHKREKCPICSSLTSIEFLKENTDWNACNEYTYSSRKLPEYMNFHLSKCLSCGLVYADLIPTESQIVCQYQKALFDSSTEATCAAKTYARLLKKNLPMGKKMAIDIGCGNGALLPLLKELGFENIKGFEPSAASYENEPNHIKDNIVPDVFSSSSIPDETADLIICCMTLEHVHDPLLLLKTIYAKLRKNGRVFLVDHNYQSPVNILLGKRSPIIDIEHLQLFNISSLNKLLKVSGFKCIRNSSFWNSYSLLYLIRLFPFPVSIKKKLLSLLSFTGKIYFRLPFGNRFIIGEK